MKNKILFLIIVILLPIATLIKVDNSNDNKEEVIENNEANKEIIVHLNDNNNIIDLSLNDYLIGVVGMEMPASFNIEALKAQAVAARTFAFNYLNNNEINITTSAQSYIDMAGMRERWQKNFDEYYKKISDAVESTDNIVIKYNEKIIKSYYYAISNGKTENSLAVFSQEYPYLVSIDSSFDENVKNFKVTTTFTNENFCKLLDITPCLIEINHINRDETNRVTSLNINNITYSGVDFRKKLSLRSTDFVIDILDDHLEITTKGYGHGVGMSQYGANYLANSGYTYDEILGYYYINTTIEKYN